MRHRKGQTAGKGHRNWVYSVGESKGGIYMGRGWNTTRDQRFD